MEYSLKHQPTKPEAKAIEKLGRSNHRELARIAISIAQEYGFVRRQDLDTYQGYTDHDKTTVLKFLKEQEILKDAYISRYPKGTIKGYEPRHKNRKVAVLFKGVAGNYYEETGEIYREYYQTPKANMLDYIDVERLKHSKEDELQGIY